MTAEKQERILVIRLSALGDVVRTMPHIEKIRAHHPRAHITFLTTPPFAPLMKDSPFLDAVWALPRAPYWDVRYWWRFARALRAQAFDCVYDLQRNDRMRYASRFAPRALRRRWYGLKGGGVPYGDALDLDSQPLPAAGDISWLAADTARYGLPAPYVLVVPGCAPQHLHKRWPAPHYADLCTRLAARGLTPVLVGTAAERGVIDSITAAAPAAVSLCGQTDYAEIASLARGAAGAVGNDTGPMHLIAAVCPVLVLFSGRTNPEQSAPFGAVVRTLQSPDISGITVDAAEAALSSVLR